MISPSVGVSRPAICLSVVVLPQPDGPKRVMKSPSSMVIERLSTAVNVPPNFLVIFFSSIFGINQPPMPLSIDAPVALLTPKFTKRTIITIIKLIPLEYWLHPFSLYWKRRVVRTLFCGVTNNTKRESSLIQEINGRRYPEMNELFWIGITSLAIRFGQLTPMISPASSI